MRVHSSAGAVRCTFSCERWQRQTPNGNGEVVGRSRQHSAVPGSGLTVITRRWRVTREHNPSVVRTRRLPAGELAARGLPIGRRRLPIRRRRLPAGGLPSRRLPSRRGSLPCRRLTSGCWRLAGRHRRLPAGAGGRGRRLLLLLRRQFGLGRRVNEGRILQMQGKVGGWRRLDAVQLAGSERLRAAACDTQRITVHPPASRPFAQRQQRHSGSSGATSRTFTSSGSKGLGCCCGGGTGLPRGAPGVGAWPGAAPGVPGGAAMPGAPGVGEPGMGAPGTGAPGAPGAAAAPGGTGVPGAAAAPGGAGLAGCPPVPPAVPLGCGGSNTAMPAGGGRGGEPRRCSHSAMGTTIASCWPSLPPASPPLPSLPPAPPGPPGAVSLPGAMGTTTTGG